MATAADRAGYNTFSVSLPDGSYRVRFSSPATATKRYLTQWYRADPNDTGAGNDFASSDLVTVAGGAVTMSTELITQMPCLYGQVREYDDSSSPLNDFEIEFFDASGTASDAPVSSQVVDDNFTIQAPPGDYKVYILALNDQTSAPGYLSGWYDQQNDFASAATVTLPNDGCANTSNLPHTVIVHQYAPITGTVQDADVLAADGAAPGVRTPITVEAYDVSGDDSTPVASTEVTGDPYFSSLG